LAVLLAAVLLFAGCDAIKGLLGEDSGPDGGGSGGGVPVVFQEIDVAGGGTTTLVTLVFDRDIPGLSDRDVTITDAGDTGAVKVALSPTSEKGIYTLAVSGVRETGEITISVGKSGYAFTPATQKAVVNFDETANKVTFANAIADGAAGSQTTTALILTFGQPGISLEPGDITLWPDSTGATVVGLQGSGTNYSLGITGIAAEGDVTVTVVKDGYAVSPATVQVTVHHQTSPLAGGGAVTLMPVEDDFSQVWEIHTFNAPGTYTLSFSPGIDSVTADYLIVAGGGGGGGDRIGSIGADYAGGGGAGGLLYEPKATLSLQSGSVAVVVGKGGEGGSAEKQGTNGEDSAIGNTVVLGGGGGGGAWSNLNGRNGGSGGGGGSGLTALVGTIGNRSSGIDTKIKGHNGGVGSATGSDDSGGGGGGAESAGQNGSGTTAGAGGNPWTASANDASWVSTVTEGTVEFSRGGNGGSPNAPVGAGVNYGDGGTGGNNTGGSGGSGHSGIVVIRFQRLK
jgi:hypothetical protein